MPEDTEQKMIGRNNKYPEEVEFDEHYSIMMVAFEHHVDSSTLNKKQHCEDYVKCLHKHGWQVHGYLCEDKGKKRKFVPRFQPEAIMTPQTHEVFFGKTGFTDCLKDIQSTSSFIKERLDPVGGSLELSEPLMFTLATCKYFPTDKKLKNPEKYNAPGCFEVPQKFNAPRCFELPSSFHMSEWLNTPLTAHYEGGKEFSLKIEWVDLFFYNDGTGILSFKVKSLADKAGINELSVMNRVLRDFKNGAVKVSKGVGGEGKLFWNDIVLNDWLGFNSPDFTSKTSIADVKVKSGLLLTPQAESKDIFDQFQRYCKVMVTAQIPSLAEGEVGMMWGRPIADPPIYFSNKQYDALQQGEWDGTLGAAQQAIVTGYATLRDLVAFELAVVSDEKASVGWADQCGKSHECKYFEKSDDNLGLDKRGHKKYGSCEANKKCEKESASDWQYSAEYIRKIIDNNCIEIWENWAGIALRDTCVFVSYDKSMPIIWQAESRYYPLYALVYHNHYQLDRMSKQIIDFDMVDVSNGRKVRDDFQRFRNQYWFQDVTVDFQGVEVYNQMKHGMEMDKQYETVSSEISDVSDHLQEKWDRGTRVLFAAGAFMLAPIMAFWNSWVIPHIKTWYESASVSEVFQLIGGIAVLFFIMFFVWLRLGQPIVSAVHGWIQSFTAWLGR